MRYVLHKGDSMEKDYDLMTMEELSDNLGEPTRTDKFKELLSRTRTAATSGAYSNSTLVNYIKRSPNHSGLRTHPIDTITIHHMAGILSVEQCGAIFAVSGRQASANYGIDGDGRVGLYVDEKNRSWASSSYANDQRAVTIEVANSSVGGDWPVSAKAMKKLIELCADICNRNGIKKLNYTGDTRGNLTLHQWFAATLCPGPYLKSKMEYIASEVNKRIIVASKYTLSGVNYPTKVKHGHAFTCMGTIKSANTMNRIEIGIVDATGKKWTKQKVDKKISSKTFNIYKSADADILFTKLKKGPHYYRCWCWDANGAKKVFDKKFTVV